MELKSIFARHLPLVCELHESIKSDLASLHRAVVEVEGNRELTLYDVLLAGLKLRTFPDPDSFKAFRAEIARAVDGRQVELPQVSKYKVFNKTEITTLNANYKFILKHRKDPLLHATSPSKLDLEHLSYRMRSPSTLLCLKYFFLHLGYGDAFTYPNDDDDPVYHGTSYNGMVASTSPVRKALTRLYGTDFKGQLAASMQQQRMAVETGIDAFSLNSVLWLMGQQD